MLRISAWAKYVKWKWWSWNPQRLNGLKTLNSIVGGLLPLWAPLLQWYTLLFSLPHDTGPFPHWTEHLEAKIYISVIFIALAHRRVRLINKSTFNDCKWELRVLDSLAIGGFHFLMLPPSGGRFWGFHWLPHFITTFLQITLHSDFQSLHLMSRNNSIYLCCCHEWRQNEYCI